MTLGKTFAKSEVENRLANAEPTIYRFDCLDSFIKVKRCDNFVYEHAEAFAYHLNSILLVLGKRAIKAKQGYLLCRCLVRGQQPMIKAWQRLETEENARP